MRFSTIPTHTIIGSTLISFILFFSAHSAPPESKEFFDILENTLREDYQICTGDSSEQTINQLISWKKQIDTYLESDSFKTLAQHFYRETGLQAFEVRPCEIVSWKKRHQETTVDASKVFSENIADRKKKSEDSLLIKKVLDNATISPLDFAGIPFGINKKMFLIFSQYYLLLPFEDEGSSIQFKNISIDGVIVNAAFHFDKNGYYRMYELESEGGPLDSLDSKIRLESAELASLIEVKSGSPPDHIYRIGRFDITQGRLAVERSWNFPSISAYAGLATFRYHYYGKIVVIARNINILPDSIYQKK